MAGRGRRGGKRDRDRRLYRDNIIQAGASPTAPTGRIVEEPTVESTASGPSKTIDLPPAGGGGRRRRGIKWGLLSSVATLIMTVIGGIVWAVIYLEGIKTTQVEQAANLKNLKESHENLVTHVKDQAKELRDEIRRGLSDLVDRFRAQPALPPTPPAQSPAPERKGSQ